MAVPAQSEQPRTGARDLDRARRSAIIGQYATMPVRVSVGGREVQGSWGMDVMVAPERQRQGLGELLFRTWDRNVGASLGLGLSESSYRLFQKLRWPDVGPGAVLREAAHAPRAAPRRTGRSPSNRLVSAVTLPIVKIVARDATAARRSAADPALRRQLHGALGRARAEVRLRRPPRCRLPELEVRRRRRTCATSSPPCVATIVTSAMRSTGISTNRAVASRCSSTFSSIRMTSGLRTLLRWIDREARARRLRQDPHVRHACRVPQGAATGRLLSGEIDDGVRRQSERHRRRLRRSTTTPIAGTSRSAIRIRIDSRVMNLVHLLVGIDTEGDNQWDAAARANQTFENIYALPRLHALFARHGVRPTYVITHPVATDRRSAEVLRGLLAGGDCEIGAHHHAWETPPCTPDDVRRHPYASMLPRRSSRPSWKRSPSAIELAVGARPVSYRSGRFGFSAEHVSALERTAIWWSRASRRCSTRRTRADRSSSRRRSGRTFSAYDNATRPGTSRVLEVPVSAALNRRLPERCSMPTRERRGPTRPSGCCARLRMLRMRWLRPSYSSLEDMMGLAQRPRARWRTSPEPAVPLERSHRRRQSVQPHAGRARRVLRAARPVSRLRDARARAQRRRRSPSSATHTSGRARRPVTRVDADPARHPAPPARPGRQRAAPVAARQLGGTGRRRGRVRGASAASRRRTSTSPDR